MSEQLLRPFTLLAPRHPRWWELVLGAVGLIATYFTLTPLIGRAVMAMNIVPFFYFSRLYGRWGGVVAAVVAVPLTLVMYMTIGGPELLSGVGVPFWATSFASILIFYEVGNGSELRFQLAVELRHSRSLADQLREERDRVQQASESKDVLLMSISHDLRTPLSAIIQSAQMIEVDGKYATTQAGLIRQTGLKMLDVVNGLLRGYRKLRTHDVEPPAPFDLHRLLEELLRLHQPLFEARSLSIELGPADDLPRWMEGHPNQVHRILVNLLSNSLKYTDQGGVRIEATRYAPDGRVPVLQLAVIDTGRGIPAHEIAPLLAAARTEPSHNDGDDQPSYGLGLGNCLRLADQIGAELLLLPNQPHGLKALLHLPWRPAQAPAHQPPPQPVLTRAATGLRTLVVDDEPANAEILSTMLHEIGCEVTSAGDGASAESLLLSNAFQLAFLDLQLPDTDGRRLAARARASTPGTFLVLFSANILLTDLEMWHSLDVDLILSKPITLEELARVCELAQRAHRESRSISRLPDSEDNAGLSERHRKLLTEYLEQCLFDYGRQDLPECVRHAHKLHGAAATLRLQHLAGCATQVEEIAASGDRIDLFPALRDLAAATPPQAA